MELKIEAHQKQRELIESPKKRIAAVAGIGGGKALSLDTLIPTVNGWITMGDIQIGDILFDESGNQCKVTSVTPIMTGHKCYKVTFSDGTEVVADAEHLWFTWSCRARKAHGRAENPTIHPSVVNTEDIERTLFDFRGWKNHAIRVCQPLQYNKQELPIDPYVLGLWLGDGNSNSARITMSKDETSELIPYIESAGYGVRICPSTDDVNAPLYSIGAKPENRSKVTGRLMANGSLTSILGENGLLHNKHIPSIFQRASTEQRLSLLWGLMDSDGCIDKSDGVVNSQIQIDN